MIEMSSKQPLSASAEIGEWPSYAERVEAGDVDVL